MLDALEGWIWRKRLCRDMKWVYSMGVRAWDSTGGGRSHLRGVSEKGLWVM